ncbi:hypothetical protein ACFE04_011969 [Oxalis oulophora]
MALSTQARHHHVLASNNLSTSKTLTLPFFLRQSQSQSQSLSLKKTKSSLASPLTLSLSFPSPIKINTRRSVFKSHATPQDDDDAPAAESASVSTLVNVYKQAILLGDAKAVSFIEAKIRVVESEKDQKVAELSDEVKTGKEKLIRLQADFDNFRKRTEKERFNIRSDAQGEVVETLLPMVDSFERAKHAIKPETETEKKIDTSYQGIYKQLVEIMRSLKVSAIATVGKPFDPLLHEAIAREESHEFKEGIIIQEWRRGFVLGDRLLRPAMVKVSSGPGSKKAQFTTDKSTEQPRTAAGIDER